MEMADRFDIPVIALVDTAGAYPGIGAEERGQAEAIARSTDACLMLGVPNVAVILGEGGSGGAIAIATANRVLMLEHAIYSVISPEGAASILWHDTSKAQDAATNMKITAEDLMRFGVIDEIVPEPVGGAHRDPAAAIAATGDGHRAMPWRTCRGSTGRPSGASGARNSSISAGLPERFRPLTAGLPFVHHIRAGTPDRSSRCLVIASSLRITDTVSTGLW